MSTFSCGAAITEVMAVSKVDTNFIFDRLEELKRLEVPLKQAQQLAVADAIARLETERQEVLAAVREKLAGMEKVAPAADAMSVPSDEQQAKSDAAVDALTDEEAIAVAQRMGKKIPARGDAKDAIKQEHPDDIAHGLAGDTWNGKDWAKPSKGEIAKTFVKSVLRHTNRSHKVELGVVSAVAAEKISNETGIEADSAMEVILADSAIHSQNKHPDLTLDDWAYLPDVVDNLDLSAIARPSKNPDLTRIIVRKVGQNGVEFGAVFDFAHGGGKKRLNLVTFFKDTPKAVDAWWEKNKGSNSLTVPNSPEPASSAHESPLEPLDAIVVQPAPEVKDAAQDSAQPAAKEGSAGTESVIDAEKSLWGRIGEGTATVDEFKAGFENWVSRKDEIVATLMKNTKDQLLKMRGLLYDRYKNEPKAELVDAMWRDGTTRYVLARSFSHGMGKNAWLDGIRNMVENTDADQLAQYAQQVKTNTEEAIARVGKIAEAIKDPKTLEDYITWMRATMREGKTFKDARMMLTVEQRAQFDELTAADSRSKRKETKDAQRTSVSVAGQTVDGNIIATKHTKKGHDVFVVQLAERVSKEDYDTLNAGAKRIGGYYSSFRGAGATPGFQFTDRAQAEAFVKLAQGDNTDAKAAAQANRDAFEDDRSQTAVQRLTEMADRLEEQADASLNQERKTNTSKRAGQAASAEASANADKAMAKTMRNIAQAIGAGTAKFLDRVRQKTQVSMLQGVIKTAKDAELRSKYESYADQERHKGEAPTAETADFAEFPTFTAYRSDLASLARQLLDVDGTKLLGQRLLKEADDVSDAYLKFSKENTGKVMIFRTKEGGLAGFSTKGAAEESIARSGYKGKAIAYQVKRGEYTVIASPSEAVERGIWKGDGDKRLTLTPEIGAELVEKIGKAARRGAKVSVPWQLETAHDRRKALARMGIETPAEFRAALREFIGLQEQAAAPSKVKELERAMIGRKNDGMDFFPTPESVADEMVTTADIQPGMSVLEPSAGWGHIAERIRAAGVDPDVGEMSNDRRELLEAKGFNVVSRDFMELNPREFYMFGDTFKSADGTEGVMRGSGGLGSNRVRLVDTNGNASFHDRDALTGIKKNGTESGYDRILMNPPFSDGRDIQHVQHAYTLLKPGGRIVAIMGESAFTNQNKRATEFREWLESVGGTEEKLAEGSFNDPSLPVNTGANARMVVIEKGTPEGDTSDVVFSQGPFIPPSMRLGPKATLGQIQQFVASVAKVAKSVIPINIVTNPSVVVGLRDQVGAGKNPHGAVFEGQIYLFTDNLTTMGDVKITLFHELFHFGLRKAVPSADYVALMQALGRNREIIKLADKWKASEIGKAEQAKHSTSMYNAIAVEEALAETEEALFANGDIGTSKPLFVRQILEWFSKVADQLGFDGVSQALRRMTMSDAEKFVNQMVRAALGGDKNLIATKDRIADGRFRSLDSALKSAANNATVNKVVDKLNEHFSHPGKVSWWDKTVGSPYHLSERSPAFKRVFEAVQRFINDVSFYANEAADLAPKLLPKMDTWRDLGKQPISAADNTAIAAPIYEGTLSWTRDESGKPVLVDDLTAKYADLSDDAKGQMLLRKNAVTEDQLKRWKASKIDVYEGAVRNRFEAAFLKPGVVWTDAELKSLFSLTPEQIGLYKQFRAAIDKSIDNMAKSEMLRAGGKDVAGLRDMAMDSVSADDASILLRDHLLMLASEDPERSDSLTESANAMIDKADKATKLKKEGYAPLSRFGRYSVDVVVDGKREYFGLFETVHDSNKMAAKMKMLHGAANVAQGTMSQKQFQLFQGVTPESLELFGNMLGLESDGDKASDKAFQDYLRLTKNNRSAMKRLIHRKGIAGYSEDVGRTLAAFVYSNARQTAAGLHMGEMGEAVNDIPKSEGELKDAAIELTEYVKNPREEAQALRGLMFAQYLGGSVASAFVNFTQPMTVSFPYLSQFGGAGKAGSALIQAMKDQRAGKVLEPGLARALKIADENGTTQPQAVHELMAQSRGAATLKAGDGTRMGDASALAGNNLAKLALGWGKLFGLAEQINRRSTFIAAYRIAVEQKMADPAGFATKAVNETQFINNKGNKAKFGRGAIGATLMTFKSYSINYLELLHRMATRSGPEGKKAAALMLGMLFLMAGAGGMPGADDLEDVIDLFAQRLGYNFSSQKAKQEFLENLFGKAGAQFVERGITGLPGAPIDVSGRMSMGNLIPGTGLLLKKSDHTRDVTEVAGAFGDMAIRAFKAGDQLLSGDLGKAILTAVPKAASNFAQGVDMASSGMYKDAKGYKVINTTPTEAAMKSIGFQPASVAQVQQANYLNQRAKDFYSLHAADIRARWAKGIFEDDKDQVQAARDMMKTWNDNNPDQRIMPNMVAIMRKVHEMKKTKEQRIADTAPKAMRNTLRQQIAERAAQ